MRDRCGMEVHMFMGLAAPSPIVSCIMEERMRWAPSFLSSRQTRVIGLDISSSAVKLVELSRIDTQYCVRMVGRLDVADHVMMGNAVNDIPALAEAIQTLLKQVDLNTGSDRGLQAVIAVPDACTIVRTVQVSERLSDRDLEDLAWLELSQCIPDALEELHYDFKRLGQTEQPGIYHMLIMGARAQYVQDRVAALRQIGLTVRVVDIESLAVQRMLPSLLADIQTTGMIVVLDLGARFLKIFFFQQERLVFMHAEEFGFSAMNYPEGIIMRYQRACHFLYTEYPQAGVLSHMIVAGGGIIGQSHLLPWLQAQCNLYVYRADPFAQMQIADSCDGIILQQDAPLYVTACGLAKRI